MARSPPLVALFLGLLLLSAREAFGAAPRREWRTVVAPRFRVHYHEGEEHLALRVAPIAEAALDALIRLLENTPDTPIHVVLTDETDSANGFAQVLPLNVITLFPAVPAPFGTLDDYDDYLRLLVVHELTHIVHLDTIDGIPRYFNDIFGKQWAPNQIQPRWFIEGIAVYVESRLSRGGRVRSSLVDMIIREQVLEDRFPKLDEISTSTRRFPGGNFVYILGGRFLDFIARKHGEKALADISHEYGTRFVPYGLNLIARHATGETFVDLWDEWIDEEKRRTIDVLGRVEAAGGERKGVRLKSDATEIYHPRFSSKGALAFVEVSRFDDAAIVVLSPGKTRELLRARTSHGQCAFTPDGRRLVATIVDTAEYKFSYADLEIIDLESGRRVRRTFGARVETPDVSPDGRTIVAVQRGPGSTRLVTFSVDGDDPPKPLVELLFGEDVAAPRWSPDGQSIVASVHRPGGGRTIQVFDKEGASRRRLTHSRANDQQPIWSADGRSVLFSSDRGGVYNIHRVAVETGAITRITNVTTGAFEPALDPSSNALAFVYGTIQGFDLSLLELDQVELLPEAPLLRPERTSTIAAPQATATAAAEAAAKAVAYRNERYAPWETLLPRAYMPTTGQDGVGDTVGVYVAATDAVGAHAYQLRLDYGLKSERIGYSFSYLNHSTFAPFSLSSFLVATERPGSFVPATPLEDRLESIFGLRVGFSIPLGRWDFGHSLYYSYGFELRRGPIPVPRDPILSPPAVTDLTLASVIFGWSFSNVRAFPDSISPARGHALSVSAEINDPRIGSDLRVLSIFCRYNGYFTLPWFRHHVVATRVAFGGAAGDARGRSVFALGGLPVRDVLRDAVDQIRAGPDALRGYEQAALRGNAYYLGSLEYRLPLFDIERGIETYPAFVDRLYAAAFGDFGDTPIERIALRNLRIGTGAELRLDFALAYYFPMTLRLGYGRGLSRGGVDNFYLVLGGTF